MKLLVADDDADLRDLIAFTLTQAGYLVIKAADGPAALKRFEEESPDLVVLDINMPGPERLPGVRGHPPPLARAGHDADRARRGGGPGAGARPRGG